MGRDGPAGFENIREVRLAVFVQRRGNADDDAFDLSDPAEIGGGVEVPAGDGISHRFVGDVLDVAFATREQFYLGSVNIQADDEDARARELQG